MAGKCTAFADFAFNLQPSLMPDHDVFDDGEAKAGAAGFAVAAAIRPVEALGQARDMGRVDAVAVVTDGKMRAAFVLPVTDSDFAFCR